MRRYITRKVEKAKPWLNTIAPFLQLILQECVMSQRLMHILLSTILFKEIDKPYLTIARLSFYHTHDHIITDLVSVWSDSEFSYYGPDHTPNAIRVITEATSQKVKTQNKYRMRSESYAICYPATSLILYL